jgi:hypothetical protein
MQIQEQLTIIQNELKVKKGKFNKFGNFKYRSAEDILEQLKPLLKKHKLNLILSDNVLEVGGDIVINSTAVLTNEKGNEATAYGVAAVDKDKAKMDLSQKYGSASSYARKFALNGLFLLDESEADPDSHEAESKKKQKLTAERFNKALEAIGAGNYTKEQLLNDYELTKEQKAKL